MHTANRLALASTSLTRPPCTRLGPPTGETRVCDSCGHQGELVPLSACSEFGVCYTDPRVTLRKVQRCGPSCSKYAADASKTVPEAGAIRHLLYFVYPAKGSNWKWNVEKLRRRLSLFNGRRVVGVAVGPETEPASAVASILGPSCRIIEAPNDPILKEYPLFPTLLGTVADLTGPEHATFYAHAKGVSSEGWGPGVRRWTNAMYSGNLDHWPAVQRLLVNYPLVGCFKRHGQNFPVSTSPWHYSGTFRWHRNRDLFARDWRTIDRVWTGSESHPGLHFRADEGGCLFGEFSEQGLCLYTDEFWRRFAGRAVEEFEEAHMADRRLPLLLTCVLTSHQKPCTVHEAIASVRGQTSQEWRLVVMDSGPLAEAGEFDRYKGDPRISIHTTGETGELRARVGIQAWAINECSRRGLVYGDLVCHLCDDDVYDPGIFAAWLAAAREHPEQSAWYGPADRCEVRADGKEVKVGELPTRGVTRTLDNLADGMQACCRREVCPPWPEDREQAWHTDGLWLDALGKRTPIHPLPQRVGRHRHTAESTFTKPSNRG